MIFIGSTALAHHGLTDRTPKDIDIIGTYNDVTSYVKNLPGEMKRATPASNGKKYIFFKGDLKIEAEIAWEGSLAEEFLKLEQGKYASINALYMLKMSHRYLRNSPHFNKTMDDIHLLRNAGAYIPDYMRDFYKRRMEATYYYKHPNLNVRKKEFFDTPGITYVYDHDSIHEAVKIGDRPAYTYFKEDFNEVYCSKEMFENIDRETQLNSVLEESYVLSIERSQVPFPGILPPRKSFELALQKVCTSITSGWWREFAWENYYTVKEMYDETYMDKFNAGLKDGTVKLVE